MQELIKDALKNVWSIPDPNSQVIIQPGRISADTGVSRVINIGWTKVGLPDVTSIWHVFQIGQIHPLLLNLFDVKNQWELVSDASNRRQLVCNLYNEYGVELPRTRTYYLRMPDNNLVIAVEKNAKIDVDFSAQALYVRIFRNQYFQSADSEEAIKIEVGGGKMTATSDITELTDRILALRDPDIYGGQVLCFVNGYKVETIDVANTKVGDVAEYVYDASIYNTSEYHITSLQSFRSILDNKAKWLLFSEADWDGYLDHCFNIDVYLIDKVTGKGVYVHKNAADTLRMVTFKDYSISSDYVQAYFAKFVDPVTKNLLVDNLYLRLHIRQDSYRQIPQDDANKTTYLLRMTNAQQQAAMVGVDSSNLIWRAENLENSAYNRLMEARYENVTLDLVENAYGYSNANRVICPNLVPTHTEAGTSQRYATVPVGFMNGATAYEYTQTGLLLGIYPVTAGVGDYPCTNLAYMVEFIEGIGGRALYESYGNDSVPTNVENVFPIVTTNHHYRCYEQINGVWTDVTAGDAYTVENGEVCWKMESSNNRLIRSDAKHLAYRVQLNPSDGVLIHSVSYPQENGMANIAVPMGEYDFWLNGYPLIEGIDYTFNFPLVEIISKEYLNSAPGPQELTVRMFGLCRSDLTPYRTKEVGFVFDGDMSVNDRYDLHEFKSLRVVSAGALIAPTKQTFVEAISSGLLDNGAPYEIRELCNSMKGFIVSDAYKLRERNEAVEKSVGDYLTLKVKPVTDSPINPIPDKYKLYSPFICKILFALKAGNIQASKISGQYADSVVEGLVAPYLPILKGDPIFQNNTPDLTYCVIHPHWLENTVYVTEDAYRFLTNVVRMYARGKVELSPLVAVGLPAV